jgi:putative flippase GtrA
MIQSMKTIWQIIKFVVVGVSNTAIDFAVLNTLIFATGVASGFPFVIFKASSFLIAVVNSYVWNKKWTFKSDRKVFTQFLVIASIGFGLNVAAAAFIVNVIGPQFGLPEKIWANVGAAIGTGVVMTSNFIGYKFLVFKK